MENKKGQTGEGQINEKEVQIKDQNKDGLKENQADEGQMKKDEMNQDEMNQDEINQDEMQDNEMKQKESDKEASNQNPSESEGAGSPDASENEAGEPEEAAASDGEEEENGEASPSGSKKGFFKKNKKKDKKDEKIEELTDQVKRQMAEFDNFRKRTEKEKTQMYEIGAKSIIEKVLPVVDNFERGLAAVPDESKEDAFVDGMNKIYKQLMTMLEEVDVRPIEAVGKEFDPNLHNAVMQTESEEYESGVVAQELQKGYTYRDSVVRHSMVAVVS